MKNLIYKLSIHAAKSLSPLRKVNLLPLKYKETASVASQLD